MANFVVLIQDLATEIHFYHSFTSFIRFFCHLFCDIFPLFSVFDSFFTAEKY